MRCDVFCLLSVFAFVELVVKCVVPSSFLHGFYIPVQFFLNPNSKMLVSDPCENSSTRLK